MISFTMRDGLQQAGASASPCRPEAAMPDTHTVDVHIPADLADRLGGPGPALDRQVLEALALAAYQAGTLSKYELRLTLSASIPTMSSTAS